MIASLGLFLLALAPPHSVAQTYVDTGFSDLPPPTAKKVKDPPPKLVFRLLAEIPLPGPLPGDDPRLRGSLVEIGVAGGTMVTEAIPDATPRWIGTSSGDAVDPRPASVWVSEKGGKMRFRSLPGGVLEAQKACRRCKAGWKRRWRLRVPGNTLVSPLVANRRVYIGGLDNRIYCLKARNGHRLWTADIDGRISTPLMLWQGEVADPTPEEPLATRELTLLLVVGDSGSEMVALESEGGLPVATLRVAEGDGKLVSGALAMPDGKVVVARQQYAETEASLMVYRLLAPRSLKLRDELTAPPRTSEAELP